jgi:hypothetical protein
MAVLSSILFVAGGAASAREGFDFQQPNAANGVMIAGALMSVAFAIAAGITYNKSRKGYEHAVEIYNDSLGLRLGVLHASGSYRPADDVVVDEEGFVLVEDTRVLRGAAASPSQGPGPAAQPAPAPAPAPQPVAPAPAPTPQPVAPAPAPTPQPAPAPVQQPRSQPVLPAPPPAVPGRALTLLPRR